MHSSREEETSPLTNKGKGESADYLRVADERVRVRRDLVSGELVYINADNCADVSKLKEVYCPSRAVHTVGVDLTLAERCSDELKLFLQELHLLDSLNVAEYASLEEAAESKALQLRDQYIPPENLVAGFFDPPPVLEDSPAAVEVVEEEGEGKLNEGDLGSLLTGSDDASLVEGAAVDRLEEPDAAEDLVEVAPVEVVFPPLHEENAVPVQLAKVLSEMWNTSETQSMTQSEKFFGALRDIRYQMVQRRRAGFDCVNKMLVCIDNRSIVALR